MQSRRGYPDCRGAATRSSTDQTDKDSLTGCENESLNRMCTQDPSAGLRWPLALMEANGELALDQWTQSHGLPILALSSVQEGRGCCQMPRHGAIDLGTLQCCGWQLQCQWSWWCHIGRTASNSIYAVVEGKIANDQHWECQIHLRNTWKHMIADISARSPQGRDTLTYQPGSLCVLFHGPYNECLHFKTDLERWH